MWTTPDVPCKYYFNKYFFPILKYKSKVSKARNKLADGFNGWTVTKKKQKMQIKTNSRSGPYQTTIQNIHLSSCASTMYKVGVVVYCKCRAADGGQLRLHSTSVLSSSESCRGICAV